MMEKLKELSKGQKSGFLTGSVLHDESRLASTNGLGKASLAETVQGNNHELVEG
jgi:hypothetical protein